MKRSAEKYIDLMPTIGGEYTAMSDATRFGVRLAFEWLDEHREACPGPTITESYVNSEVATAGRAGMDSVAFRYGFSRALVSTGTTIVPDPKPELPTEPGSVVHDLDGGRTWVLDGHANWRSDSARADSHQIEELNWEVVS